MSDPRTALFSDKDVIFEFREDDTLLKIVNNKTDAQERVFELRYDVLHGVMLMSATDMKNSSMMARPLRKKEGNTYHFSSMVLQRISG